MHKKGQAGIIVGVVLLVVLILVVFYFVSYYNQNDNLVDDLDRNFCTDEDRNADACVLSYSPVCGWSIENLSIETYSNNCVACMSENVNFWTEGDCPN